tara:strand:+ start:302 stop:532 length:231 start_codon:yes stop_codon:yes gene_type:complete
MSSIKNELINSLNNNQLLEGMKQLNINELDLITVLIGTCLGLELSSLTPDNEKIAQLNKLNGTIILMKTELKSIES